MSEETEKRLVNWEAEEGDIADNVHWHFESLQSWYWCDIASEGSRLYGLMFLDGEPVEFESPIAALHSGIAAASANGVISAFAFALGLEEGPLKLAIANWYERQGQQMPVGLDALMSEYKDAQRWMAEIAEERAQRLAATSSGDAR